MSSRQVFIAVCAVLAVAAAAAPARAQDADLCFNTADAIKAGTDIADKDREAAHKACQRALADTSSIIQKYHLQEADFDVSGTRPNRN